VSVSPGNKVSEKISLYTVIRVDEFERVSDDERITIKEILPTLEEAVEEVERLNKLQKGKRCHYFWRLGRYYPQGRAKELNESVSDSE
jgi:hypothetical protein